MDEEEKELLKNGVPSYEEDTEGLEIVKAQRKRYLDIFHDDKTVSAIIKMMNGFFAQGFSPFFTGNFLAASPGQGWKLHISAKDKDDYINIIFKLVPVFNELNAKYKLVAPGRMNVMSGEQTGKYITVYLGTADAFAKFLSAVPKDVMAELLTDSAVPVPGEIHVGGRMYARYGSFVTEHILDPCGKLVYDERGCACPKWVSARELTDALRDVLPAAV